MTPKSLNSYERRRKSFKLSSLLPRVSEDRVKQTTRSSRLVVSSTQGFFPLNVRFYISIYLCDNCSVTLDFLVVLRCCFLFFIARLVYHLSAL
ncbi:hypothetical protein BT96DRAFT_593736 [Gymnopus androsaceus JB14]|uniref:Uncharacterized protein n=1 Tax=Gymnopus androsaceus JB14 TaxID=1447944 RepID=A0A6A4HYC1_9AGAR|nr:hypothetical protein BT96DRAFT_593736 [Gymnopus androsaceus JB14]